MLLHLQVALSLSHEGGSLSWIYGSVDRYPRYPECGGWCYDVGEGLWGGIFFVATGGLGLASAIKPTKLLVIALCPLSSLSALMSLALIIQAGIRDRSRLVPTIIQS